MKNSKLRH